MPKVWYPFPMESIYFGKYFEGVAPAGNIKKLQSDAGFLLEKPRNSDIVTEWDVIHAEVADAENALNAAAADLEALGKSSLVAAVQRQVAGLKQAISNAADPTAARALLGQLEQRVEGAQSALHGIVVPTAAIAPVAVAPPVSAEKPARGRGGKKN